MVIKCLGKFFFLHFLKTLVFLSFELLHACVNFLALNQLYQLMLNTIPGKVVGGFRLWGDRTRNIKEKW